MGNGKKEKNRRARDAASTGDKMSNVKVKGENFYRDATKVKKVNMYKEGKPVRNAKGDIIKDAPFQSKEVPKARVEPNRRWFGNTRVIAQDALAEFRDRLGGKIGDPYQVLLKRNKLPLSLLQEKSTVLLALSLLCVNGRRQRSRSLRQSRLIVRLDPRQRGNALG
jgi:nuclear GTP-binding protein